MDKFGTKYDEKTGILTLKSKVKLTPEEQRVADQAVESIADKYGIVIKKLAEE